MIEKYKMNPSKNIVPDTVDLLKVAPVGLAVSGGSKEGLKGVVLAPSDISRTGIVMVYMKLMASLIRSYQTAKHKAPPTLSNKPVSFEQITYRRIRKSSDETLRKINAIKAASQRCNK
jgi:hypothetical protein